MTVRRRLVGSTALIALAAVLVLGVPLALVEAARVRADQRARLDRETDAIVAVIDDRIEAGTPITSALLARHTVPGHRTTVTLGGGKVVVAGTRRTGEARVSRVGSSEGSTVTVAAPLSEENRRVHRAWALLVLLAGGGVAFSVALARLQARRLSLPLERMALTSARLGDGDFSARAPRCGVPEIDGIAQALDDSARRIAGLVAREREFSANASHQLRTPLTALRLRVEEAGMLGDEAARRRELEAALNEADRLEATIVALLAHAREQRDARQTRVDAVAIAREHVERWAPLLARDGRSLTLTAAGSIEVLASPGTVGEVLDVLIDNARAHGRGPVVVEVVVMDGRGLVRVADAGSGVPGTDRERIFERGASGAGGTGIGLHLARALADADGASLMVAEGSRFELHLTLAGPAQDQSPSPPSSG